MSTINKSYSKRKDNHDINLEIDIKQMESNENKNDINNEIQNKNDFKELSIPVEGNFQDFQQNEDKNYGEKLNDMINYLDKFDKKISMPLHSFSPSFEIECIFYCFARLFNIDTIIIYLLSTIIYFYVRHKNAYMVLIPICHVICGALFTMVTKSTIKRPRPILSTNRYFKLKESNHSMPSGDSLQAGIFATMIILYNTSVYRFLGILLIPAAILGRIFYNLHYWFDCLIGAASGIIISIVTYDVINKLFF